MCRSSDIDTRAIEMFQVSVSPGLITNWSKIEAKVT
jgi:hypothetical protein